VSLIISSRVRFPACTIFSHLSFLSFTHSGKKTCPPPLPLWARSNSLAGKKQTSLFTLICFPPSKRESCRLELGFYGKKGLIRGSVLTAFSPNSNSGRQIIDLEIRFCCLAQSILRGTSLMSNIYLFLAWRPSSNSVQKRQYHIDVVINLISGIVNMRSSRY
jgi:hypothetical protein